MKKNGKAIRNQANAITAKYSRRLTHAELQNMYAELAEIGVTTGMITDRMDILGMSSWRGSSEWYVHGELMEDSRFIYSAYEDPYQEKVEYNIYFS